MDLCAGDRITVEPARGVREKRRAGHDGAGRNARSVLSDRRLERARRRRRVLREFPAVRHRRPAHPTAMKVAAAAAFVVLFAAQADNGDALRDRLDNYLIEYEPQLSSLVADERMSQRDAPGD